MGEAFFEPDEAEVHKLSAKVQEQIKRGKEQEYAFKRERERKASQSRLRLTVDDVNKVIEKLENPQSPALELTPVFASTSDTYYKDLKKIDEDYKYYMEGFDIAEEISNNEEITLIKMLLQILLIPRRVIRILIKFHKKHRSALLFILKAYLLSLSFYLLMRVISPIVSPLLNRAFLALKNQILLGKEKLKKQLTADQKKEDQIEESKEFWDQHLGSLSQVVKISRGGSLVPIREANIYEFSEFDQEQVLLFASPIPAYIKFQSSKLELEKLIVESQRTLIPRKRLSLTLKEFPSKLKKFISNDVVYKVIPIGIGISIFLMAANGGTMILVRPRNLYNYKSVAPIEKLVPSVLPRIGTNIKETSQNTNSILMEMKNSMKDSLNPTSRLKSVERVRKKAKLVRLSDLPPLPDQASNLEIDSPLVVRPSSLKIRY